MSASELKRNFEPQSEALCVATEAAGEEHQRFGFADLMINYRLCLGTRRAGTTRLGPHSPHRARAPLTVTLSTSFAAQLEEGQRISLKDEISYSTFGKSLNKWQCGSQPTACFDVIGAKCFHAQLYGVNLPEMLRERLPRATRGVWTSISTKLSRLTRRDFAPIWAKPLASLLARANADFSGFQRFPALRRRGRDSCRVKCRGTIYQVARRGRLEGRTPS